MAGLVPPAGPKPLRRGEGPAIPAFVAVGKKDVDARHKAGHDEMTGASAIDPSAEALRRKRRRIGKGRLAGHHLREQTPGDGSQGQPVVLMAEIEP